MSPCFKNWFKSFSAVFLILFLHFNARAQGSSLLPEANRISGLPSNAVRCVALDKEGRIWTGTDNGLSILNANSISQKNIIAKIGNTSIWGINFLDSLVFVGSRFDGLFVFNFYTGKLINQFPSRAITLIRKIKVINGQVYILSNNGAYKWGDNKIIKLKFTENIQDDFPTDMFYWQGALYALSLRPFSLDFNVLKFNKNGFEEISTDKFFPIKNKKTILCAQTAGNILVIGGHGFYTILRDSLPPEMFTLPLNQKESFAVWDIAITKDNILLALGENISGNKGCLYVHGKTILKKEALTQCFITSFALDTANKSLYYGSLTNGLYLQRAINEILPINYQRKST
ncbi:MAG: hypothetical protein H7221_02850, partial [Flavobacterium sp.]|nr:hypothetical protein [Flavobacterium sp.]